MKAFRERLQPSLLLAHKRAFRRSAESLIVFAALLCSSSLWAQKAPPRAPSPNTLSDSARLALKALDSIYRESRRILQRVDSASQVRTVAARPAPGTAITSTGRRATTVALVGRSDSVAAKKTRPVILAVIPAVAEPDSLVEILLGQALAIGDSLSLRDVQPDSILAQQVKTVRFSSLIAPIVNRHGRAVVVRVPSRMERGSQPSIVSEGPTWSTPPYKKFAVGGFEEIRRAAWKTGLWYVLALLGATSAFITWRSRVTRRLTSEKESKWRSEMDQLRFDVDGKATRAKQFAVVEELNEESALWEAASGAQEDKRLGAEIPEELVDACATGNCVLFVGPGASAQAGYPTRWEMLLRLQGQFSHKYDLANDLRFAMKSGDSEAASELIASKVPPEELRTVVDEMYFIERELPGLHQDLAKIPFTSAYTTNWDALLEKTFADRNPLVVLLGRTSENLDAALKPDQFIIGKLFGAADASDSFLFLTDEFRRSLFRNPFISKLIMSELRAKSWFFLGSSLDGIQRFVSALPERSLGIQRHFALVPLRPDWNIHAERLRSKSGIELLGFTPTAGFPQVGAFAKVLRARVEQVRALAPAMKPQPTATGSLTKVVLQNLGPFEHLQLDLNPHWNVFLGNNGSGKSTILRAIALALSGDEPTVVRPAAERLLRVGSTEGRVDVTLDGVTYTTTVKREPTGVSVLATQFTPLQRGTVTVLGFPPLRGLSLKNPSGAAPTNSAKPTVGDVAPLLGGTIDTRMDNLKQWVVNVDVNSVSASDVTAERATRSGALRDAFFRVLQDLSPNTVVKFSSVDRHTWQVNVETPDGIVPIDQVSQGMSSLLGWVGTTLQRMYEIRPSATNPESESAIVLVDEIDAHLHPEWQKLLVSLLTKQFPNTQFIATTHSPLVVAGMKANEVFIAQRSIGDSKKVTVEPAPLEFEGMRADQILTSPLFGLSTTRSSSTASDMDRYAALLSKPDSLKSEEERAELTALRSKLDPFISIGETPLQRAVESAVRKAVKEVPILPGEGPGSVEISEDAALEIHRQLSELFSQTSESK
jgi:energy-coupling factor transporter ATP-binding protein EcfA2